MRRTKKKRIPVPYVILDQLETLIRQHRGIARKRLLSWQLELWSLEFDLELQFGLG